MRVRLKRTTLMVLLASTAALQPACARNPVTGQLQLALIPEAQEIEMGRQAAEEAVRSLGLVDDPQLQSYVQNLGARLAADSERPQLPWTFGVVDDPTPNAFALPGGFIFFTRGMMNLMSSEAELAAVLAHEIAHVTARHHVTRLSRAQLAQLGLGLGGVFFPQLEQFGGLAGAGLQLVFLQHSREAERQADEVGFRYAAGAGYDMQGMVDMFITLARLGEEAQRSAIPSWLATHPAPANRIQAAEAMLAGLGAATVQPLVGRAEYLQRIDGLVYGVNPRQGFFREGHFLHPDLRFQMAFPTGWRTQNLAQAVMALSPQQNAMIQLTLARDPSPDQAAQRFMAQQGLQVGQVSRHTINGLPGTSVPFRAQTQQGVLQGLALFVSHENRVYQLIGYSMAQVYPQVERIFQQSLGSFAPLTDPQVLAVQPDRMRIVRLEQSMTLAEFNQRFPSAVSLEELAVLNGVEGGATVLPAGTRVKRVVRG
jgi:predicted Zn-dependent protease